MIEPLSPVHLIGVPLDLGAGRRGVDMGPSALRLTGLTARIGLLGRPVEDMGDLPVPIPESCAIGTPNRRFVREIADVCRRLAGMTARSAMDGNIPVALGGDHSLAAGSVAGVSAAHRRKGSNIGLIWVDAHADMNTPESSPSGNVHGMPLAALLGSGPEELNDLAPDSRLRPEHVALVGIRNLDEREKGIVRQSGVRAYTMSSIDRHGLGALMDEILQAWEGEVSGIHLSLDLDGLDPQVAPGVGTAVRGGLSYREAHFLCEIVADTGKLAGMDLVELNPTLDHRNQTAEVGAELILSALGQRIL